MNGIFPFHPRYYFYCVSPTAIATASTLDFGNRGFFFSLGQTGGDLHPAIATALLYRVRNPAVAVDAICVGFLGPPSTEGCAKGVDLHFPLV